ncbi:uncharacterized protein DS421_18g608940 [Arachis hypogaea]|uniref:Uncharacterized protein n=1 Tax=Arachis hypogaea TaxID=3818 RepID=A0A444Y6T5_ARAHY|nr:uncharacterized protein DS421_18g608940 [Arachis hypogaea]RYQ97639.1 hypothetical protein Ahy_B08g093719 [Arachis hypogaea]
MIPYNNQEYYIDDTDILSKIEEFVPFSSSIRRLDDKPSTPSDKQASSSSCMAKHQDDNEHKSSDSKSSSNKALSTTFGKLLLNLHKASQKFTQGRNNSEVT